MSARALSKVSVAGLRGPVSSRNQSSNISANSRLSALCSGLVVQGQAEGTVLQVPPASCSSGRPSAKAAATPSKARLEPETAATGVRAKTKGSASAMVAADQASGRFRPSRKGASRRTASASLANSGAGRAAATAAAATHGVAERAGERGIGGVGRGGLAGGGGSAGDGGLRHVVGRGGIGNGGPLAGRGNEGGGDDGFLRRGQCRAREILRRRIQAGAGDRAGVGGVGLDAGGNNGGGSLRILGDQFTDDLSHGLALIGGVGGDQGGGVRRIGLDGVQDFLIGGGPGGGGNQQQQSGEGAGQKAGEVHGRVAPEGGAL